MSRPLTAIRSLALAVLAAIFAVVLAQPAAAHNELISSDPKDKDSLDAAPSAITLTFNADVQAGPGNQIVVSGPGDVCYTDPDGEVSLDGSEARVDVPALGPSGEYTIGYRILSEDGHVVSDKLTFTLTADDSNADPASQHECESVAADQSDHAEEDGGVPLWVWIVGAVVLLGAGMVFALRPGKEH